MPLENLSEIRSKNAKAAPRSNGKFITKRAAEASNLSKEVATVQRAEFMSPLNDVEFPNFSTVINDRSRGQGLKYYDTMLATDADLAGFFQSLNDAALHFDWYIRAASDKPEHKQHKAFIDYAFRQIPQLQNVKRNILDGYARGFSVTEKIYALADRGEWKGAVVYADLYDKPQRWFTFDSVRRLRMKSSANVYPGELLPQEKFIVATFGTNHTPWGEPVLDQVYVVWYVKHHAIKNQALFFEKFAQPTPMAMYRQGTGGAGTDMNKNRRREALEAAMSFQVDQALAIPEGMEIKLLESSRSGAISYEAYISQLTQAESRLVTGQVLTSMIPGVGSYAQARVHAKEESNKVEMLTYWMDSIISRHMIRDLIDRNFGVQDAYPRHETFSRSDLERQAAANVDAQLMANGIPMSLSWASERYQVVAPDTPKDVLVPNAAIKSAQPLPVNPQL